MIFEACILGMVVIVSAIIVANTLENLAHEFFKRWDALDD